MILKNDTKNSVDTGLNCLVAIARFHRLPAEREGLSHQFAIQGQLFVDTELFLFAKSLTLKSKILTLKLSELNNVVLSVTAKFYSEHYIFLTRFFC